MNYFKYVGLLMLIFGVLTACQNNTQKTESSTENTGASAESNSDESQAESAESSEEETSQKNEDKDLQAIKDKVEDIDSYKAQLDLTATLDDVNEETLDAEVDIINGDPPQMKLRSGGEERTISRDGQTYFYNGSDWINVSESVDANLLYSVTYNQAVTALEEMSNNMEVSEEEGKLVYEYHGENLDVYRNLETLIQVNFGQISLESVESNIKFFIDKEEKIIEEIVFDVKGVDSEGTFAIDGQAAFSDFNNIEEIELPQ